MLDELKGKGVSVYLDINDLYTPTFENYKLANIEDNFIVLQDPNDYNFIYLNIDKIVYIARYKSFED